MKRRDFVQLSALAGLGFALPTTALSSAFTNPEHSIQFKELTYNLLKNWCDGMLSQQISDGMGQG
jgi:hypothetical protein